MVQQVIHNATVTLQLSFYLSVGERVEALRAAGIPVDETGNATAGYLFVRTTGPVCRRKNTYRWFATGVGAQADAADAPPGPAWAGARADATGSSPPAGSSAMEHVPTTVMYLRLWKELEQRSREAACDLHRKQIAYFRDQGPPPDALDQQLMRETMEAASKCLAAVRGQNDPSVFRR
ncbi:hypothetical protein [Variovorax paradoxus]|uniref:hypothetical protein n=1 Tax=Variovorax paradoxus TaxID=34073 RepID=UPI002782F1F2|nr:hypothetical protein [Variovorax paradoxus]MDQ0590592.1 hypothetical protein [Variovorax paradoxus]